MYNRPRSESCLLVVRRLVNIKYERNTSSGRDIPIVRFPIRDVCENLTICFGRESILFEPNSINI